jgi:hypothetical protein
METSGMTTSAGGTGKTTAQMKVRSTYFPIGWDFDEVWEMDDMLNEQSDSERLSNQTDLEMIIAPNNVTVTMTNDGYPYLQIIPNATQPIELLSFWAEDPNNGTLFLQWSTAREEENDFFEILKSIDGESFESIGKINGSGNSSEILVYTFVDNKPFIGRNYYRLRQVDYDGTATTSKLISIRLDFGEQNQPFVYPNPNNGTKFFVVLPATPGEYSFTLTDVNGRQIWQTKRLTFDYLNTLEFEMPERLNSGTFILNIQGKNVNVTKRILVEPGKN